MTATVKVLCRYTRQSGDQCTGEALDPTADVLICTKHAARVMALIRSGMKQTGITKAPAAQRN